MKSFIKLIVLTIIISSCGGKDDPPAPPQPEVKEPGAFNLVFPDNNLICTEGIDVGDDEVSIDFMWTASANAASYSLDITNLDTNETTSTTSTTTSKEVTLPKDAQFSWQVTASISDKTKESASWSFYSEGIAQENFAPFPAEITTEDQLNGFVEISWTGSDLDDDIDTYELYFGTDSENLDFIVSTASDDGSSSQPITYGTKYYIEVITTDDRGNSSSSKTAINY